MTTATPAAMSSVTMTDRAVAGPRFVAVSVYVKLLPSAGEAVDTAASSATSAGSATSSLAIVQVFDWPGERVTAPVELQSPPMVDV